MVWTRLLLLPPGNPITHPSFDFAITNAKALLTFTRTSPPIGSADHCLVHLKINRQQSPDNSAPRTQNLYPICRESTDWNSLNCQFANVDWDILLTNDSIDSMYDSFLKIYHNVVRHSAHCAPRARTNDCQKRALPADIRHLIFMKKRYWNLYKRHNSPALRDDYRTARNRLKSAIRLQRRRETERTLDEILRTNNAKRWHQFTKIIYKGEASSSVIPPLNHGTGVFSNPADKANLLNEVFLSHGSSDKSHVFPSIAPRTDKLFCELSIDEEAVMSCLKNLDISKATGPDGVQCLVLKHYAATLTYPISLIFKKSLKDGCLPQSWKLANVVPVFKNKGQRSDPTQYRPISLLSNVGKIVEKLVNDQIVKFLLSNELITNKQFGFLPKLGSTDQLAFLHHELMSVLEEKMKTIGLFLDFSSAFDSIPHSAILQKLPAYGIRSNVFKWISNYLSDRNQAVVVNGHHSERKHCWAGVPQGSPLAPTLFLIFINDLTDILLQHNDGHETKNNCVLYADDVMFYTTGSNFERLLQSIRIYADLFDQWAKIWGLRFNHRKTVAVIFEKPVVARMEPIVIDSTRIFFSHSHKHLGFSLRSDLSFSSHVDSLCQQVASQVFLLRLVKQRCPNRDVLLSCYKKFILPLFNYAAPVFSALSCRDSDRLEKLQRRAIRIILGYDYWSPLSPQDYNLLKLCPLKARRNVAVACWGFKLFRGFIPGIISTLRPFYPPAERFTRHRRLVIPQTPRIPSRFLDSSPICFAVKILNSIPAQFLLSTNVEQFKRDIWRDTTRTVRTLNH